MLSSLCYSLGGMYQMYVSKYNTNVLGRKKKKVENCPDFILDSQ